MRLLFVEKPAFGGVSHAFDSQTQVERSHTADDALSLLRFETFDAVVIDLATLSEGGLALIKRLHSARNQVPVVALTGHDPADRVRALEQGASDALAHPIHPAEFRARLSAIIRRHSGYAHPVLQVGALSLSQADREVRFAGKPVRVTNHEYAILELLVLRRGGVVTKDMFLTRVYAGADEPESKIIDVFICKLRRKLAAVGGAGVIDTVWGRGYAIRAVGEETAGPERDPLAASHPEPMPRERRHQQFAYETRH